jgi:membrane fusion protein (multidrug efflux system)
VAVFQAQRAYEDSRCASPFAGVLVSRFVDRFQNAPPGTPTVRVANLSRLEAVVSIPESEAFAYREGQKAEFQLLQGEAAPIAGRIHGLDRAVEARNRTVMARIELSNPGNSMRPGMVGRARILRGSFAKALVVPSQAILRLQDGTALMRVDGNLAHKVAVTVGPARGDSVLILSGIAAGDRIITVGAFQVSEGTKVDF